MTSDCKDPNCPNKAAAEELFRLLQAFKNREAVFHADLEWLLREHNAKEMKKEGGSGGTPTP